MAEHVVTMDADAHAEDAGAAEQADHARSGSSENEDFMWRLVDQQIDKFIDRGACEFMADYAKPFSMLVIADLLGVPLEDHDEFRAALGNEPVGELGDEATRRPQPVGVAGR